MYRLVIGDVSKGRDAVNSGNADIALSGNTEFSVVFATDQATLDAVVKECKLPANAEKPFSQSLPALVFLDHGMPDIEKLLLASNEIEKLPTAA